MIVDINNCTVIAESKPFLLSSLLSDLDEFNTLLVSNGKSDKQLYIEYIDEHTEYSPERTEPCPDYYGMYRLRRKHNDDIIGVEMTIEELDIVCCAIIDFEESKS